MFQTLNRIKVSLVGSALLGVLVCHGNAHASSVNTMPDLASQKGFDTTCASLHKPVSKLTNVQERQAYVICQDVSLLQRMWTSVYKLFKSDTDVKSGKESFPKAVERIQKEWEGYLHDLTRTRKVLESLTIKEKKEGLLLKPGMWVVDLNGDGVVSPSEQYFFALPMRKHDELSIQMPSEDEAYYREHPVQAQIRVDQSDVLWALSYHYFAESLLELALSYRLEDMDKVHIVLKKKNLLQVHNLIAKGLQTSEKLRQSILAETDDEDEWIANPRQKNTVFPIPMDAQDFVIWEKGLSHVIPLFEGKTLLKVDDRAGRLLGKAAKTCAPHQGLNVKHLFAYPPRALDERFDERLVQLGLLKWCDNISEKKPASGLWDFAEEFSNRQSEGMKFLRYFLWVN